MILLLRGHIRGAFDNRGLLNLVKSFYNINNNLTIYIHTWDVIANNISWRNIKSNDTNVTNDMIYNYFQEFKHLIKHIIIEKDSDISLIGNLHGNVSASKMPLIGWKNYWHGKYSIMNYIYKNVNTAENVINCRYDILTNSNSRRKPEIIKFVNKIAKYKLNNIVFINKRAGIDNIYIGNIKNMHTLIYNFYYFLDDILKRNPKVVYQEELVFKVNKRLFN